jgi:hypothetical protein
VLPAILLRFEHLGAIETQQCGLLSISYFVSLVFFYRCIPFIDMPEFRPYLFNHFNTVVSNFAAGSDELRYDNVAGGSAPPFTVPVTQNTVCQVLFLIL